MSEFNLSLAPERSALILVRGDAVQENHVHNFGKVLRYGQVAVLPTIEVEDGNPIVGMPMTREAATYEGLVRIQEHVRDSARWIGSYATEKFGLEPFTYDVHLLDGTPDQEVEILKPHWRGVAEELAHKPRQSRYSHDRAALIWDYEPFLLEDKTLEGADQRPRDRKPTIEEWVEILQANRLPVRYEYATATLWRPVGELKTAKVTFGYPTLAGFERTRSSKWHEPTVHNSDGDEVVSVTERSRRRYAPEIPPHLQAELDAAYAANDQAVKDAIERYGDDLMFMSADDGTTDYNNAARLAPLYNLL